MSKICNSNYGPNLLEKDAFLITFERSDYTINLQFGRTCWKAHYRKFGFKNILNTAQLKDTTNDQQHWKYGVYIVESALGSLQCSVFAMYSQCVRKTLA